MKSVKYLLLAGMLLPFVAAWAQDNDFSRQERGSVRDFSGVSVSGTINLYLRQGSSEQVTVETRGDYQENVITEVNGGMLKIYQESAGWFSNSPKVNVYVTVDDISKLESSGATRITIETALQGNNMRFSASGSSRISSDERMNFGDTRVDVSGSTKVELAALNCGKFDCGMSGSSSVEIAGTAGNMTLGSSGASKFRGIDFAVNNCQISSSGASNMSINAGGELSASMSGASKLKYAGNPGITKLNTSGSANISSANR